MDTGNVIEPEKLSVGWIGYYTRKNGSVWFRCTVIAFDYDGPVIRTATGHYHLRPRDEYTFSRHPPKQDTRK